MTIMCSTSYDCHMITIWLSYESRTIWLSYVAHLAVYFKGVLGGIGSFYMYHLIFSYVALFVVCCPFGVPGVVLTQKTSPCLYKGGLGFSSYVLCITSRSFKGLFIPYSFHKKIDCLKSNNEIKRNERETKTRKCAASKST